jgi:hypothetical protein
VQVLLVGDVLISGDVRVVSLITIGKELVTAFVGDGEGQAKSEDDEDLGDTGDHADDDAGGVAWCLYMVSVISLGRDDIPASKKAYGPTILPTPTPTTDESAYFYCTLGQTYR